MLGWLFSFLALVTIFLAFTATASWRTICKVYLPKVEVANLQAALEAYRSFYGKYPGGTAAQILSALRGENTSSNVFLTVAPRSVNAAGEFIDPWGMPYHIIFDASGKPDIYSFGPNRQDGQGKKGSDDITPD